MVSNANTCRYCGAPIAWATNAANGHQLPIDPTPTADGNVTKTGRVDYAGRPLVDVHANDAVAFMTGHDRPRYTAHRSTCPTPHSRRRRQRR